MKIDDARRSQSCKRMLKSQCFSIDDFEIESKIDFNQITRKKILKKGYSDATDMKMEVVHSDIDFQLEKDRDVNCDTINDLKCQKARWHSFERKPPFSTKNFQIACFAELTAAEVSQIKPITILRLNNIINCDQKFVNPSMKSRISNIFRRIFFHDSNKIIPNTLQWYTNKFGCSLPPFVLYAIEKLGRDGISMEGIFRKSGKKSNIKELEKNVLENTSSLDLTKFSNYDLADFLKSFFRNLAEPVVTNNFTSLFTSIQDYPLSHHLTICQSIFVLMPDENREALFFIFNLLKKIARNSETNLMNSHNLAICITPCLCNQGFGLSDVSRGTVNNFSKSGCYKNSDTQGKTLDVGAVNSVYGNLHQAMAFLIENIDELFNIPSEAFSMIKLSMMQDVRPMSIHKLGKNDSDHNANFETFMDDNLEQLIDEHKNKFRSWKNEIIVNLIPISLRKIKDSYPLNLYRGYIDLEVPPSELFTCYLYKGSLWNGNTERFVIKNLTTKSDIFYQRYSLFNNPYLDRDFTLLRKWKRVNETYFLSCTSVKITQKDLANSSLPLQQIQKIFAENTHKRAFILGSRVIVEPIQGKTRFTFILRIDLRGKDPAIYKHITPYIISQELNSLKGYFNPSINPATSFEVVV